MYEIFDWLRLYHRIVNKLPFSIIGEMEKLGVPNWSPFRGSFDPFGHPNDFLSPWPLTDDG